MIKQLLTTSPMGFMYTKTFPGPATDRSAPSLQGAWVLIALFLALSGQASAQPTVNGLFYGDGDDALYSLYATSQFGSTLYNYYDASTNVMYVALVVSHQVNDNVCSPMANKVYTASASPFSWNQHRSCKRASDSEFASFTLECAPGSPQSWAWQQATGCAQNLTEPHSNWVSDSSCGPSSPAADWPPGVEATSTTSWVENVNNYQAAAPATRAWDLYAFGTNLDKGWKSPFVASAPDDVTQVPGYPTYSSTDGGGLFYEWEWSMVYEWSVDLGPTGTDCGDNVIVFITGNSHHSPGKHGSQDDPFDPPTGDATFSDFGDLPDSYLTTTAVGGARHYIKVNTPFLGQNLLAETDGQPTSDASGDGSEEDGITANYTNGNWTVGSTQTFDVEVSRAPAGALLGVWFDWNGDGDFGDPGEFQQLAVVEGTNTLTVTIPAGFDWSTDVLNARFRLFSSGLTAPGGSLDAADFSGTATDGEVEDYTFSAGTLPVTMNAFSSEYGGGGTLDVRWQTASETDNVGFELLGRVDGEWQPLGEFVKSAGMSSALPTDYDLQVFLPDGVSAIELVNYDTRGRPERYGPFRLGASYGDFEPVKRVDWSKPRAERQARLEKRGFSKPGKADLAKAGKGVSSRPSKQTRWRNLQQLQFGRSSGARTRKTRDSGPMTHVEVTEAGIQRVSYEMLRDGGLDLLGAPARDIAVTLRGEPVARWVEGRGSFGPGSSIEFIGQPPVGDDALYIDSNLYQVSIDRRRALQAEHIGRGRASRVSDSYLRESMVDSPTKYHQQSPSGDPWIEQTVLVRGTPSIVNLTIPVEAPVLNGPSRLILGLGTVTNLPDLIGPDGSVIPEHNVEVWFGGPDSQLMHLADSSTSGQQNWQIEADIPAGLLQAGVNNVQLRFETDYFYSLVLIDRYGVRYPSPYVGSELDFDDDPKAEGYRVEGFGGSAISAYAETKDGSLVRIDPWVRPFGGGYSAELRKVEAVHYWISERPLTPVVFTTDVSSDPLAEAGDLVIIAASGLVGSQALDDYVAAKAEFDPVVIDVEDVYNSVGFGMALPAAITNYLKARDEVHPFDHVQLVGTDCYDRLNYVSECMSLIPLPTAPVGVTIYSPSQNRLVDLDGDGIGDKAVGQFSVRDESELAIIVEKIAAWSASGQSSADSALYIAEETDGIHGFAAQIDRLQRRLGWNDTDVLDMADHPDINTAREALRTALDQGRTVTVFSGHSSPTVWGYRSLLAASSVDKLTNVGLPTIMVPLACETSYDISPSANVLGHQLLYGGDQGALAISGAVALSSLEDNEEMATFILDGLDSGLTLGEAVQMGRESLGTAYQTLLDNWVTQGDVTARTAP
jgi:hypothetical protein